MKEPLDDALDPAPRGSLRLLTDRVFGPYFAAKILSSVGVWVHNIVAAVVVFQLTRSALLVGAVSVAQFLPQVLLAPLAGARADRGNRQRQLALARLTSGLGSAVLAVWVGLVGVEGLPGPAPVIAMAFVVGVGFAVGGPAMHAIIPAMVRPSELSAAIALNHAPFTLARAVGPALGALLLAVAGPATAFAFAAATSLVYAAIVARLRLRPVERRTDGDGSVRAGLRHLRLDPVCALLLAGVVTLGFGVDPVITLTPSIAAQLGGGEALVGVLVSSFGVGAVLTVLVVGRVERALRDGLVAPLGLGLLAAGLVVLAMAGTVAVAVAGLLVGGAGMMLAITSLTTHLQQRLPEEMRGRIMALWSVAFIGSRPLAAAINGAVADFAAVELALALMAGLLVAGALVTRPARTQHPVPRAWT